MNKDTILLMENIRKTFPGVVALKNVSFRVRRASVHALVGENGAGKSTLMKILSGNYQADSGAVYLEGKRVRIPNPKAAMRLGISMVHQELNAVPEMTIGENLFLGREPKNKLGVYDSAGLHRDAEGILKEFNLDLDARMPIKELSVANMQMVEIVKAISQKAKIIVMDEPTSSITDREVDILFDFIRRLKEDGVTIIYISHRLEELDRIADDVTVLRDGETIDTKPKEQLDKETIVRMMVGRAMTNYYPKTEARLGDVVMEVKNLNRKNTYRDISFAVRAGEILGIAGLIGAGRTEVVSSLFGLLPYDSGEILLGGRPVRIRNTREAIDRGIALVPEDRKKLGLVLGRSIGENITLPHLSRYRSYCLNRRRENLDVQEQIGRFAIKTPGAEYLAGNLSGGNQQKVVLGKWLLARPRVLILDEPTRGIDVGSKQEIYRYMSELASQGIAIIMISSELPEILGMSDRILVMSQGRISGQLDIGEADSEKIMHYAMEGMQ